MNDLALHVDEELVDEFEYDDMDIVDMLRNNQNEIRERLFVLERDIERTAALEEISSNCIKVQYVTKDDIEKCRSLLQDNHPLVLAYNEISTDKFALESFDTLLNVGSSIAKTASNVGNKAAVAAGMVKDGVIAGSKFAMFLYERVQENIVKIASSWDIVCSLIEKRWLGLKQLSNVYNLQHSKLKDKFDSLSLNESSLAFFKVKLFVGKLRNDGRDITKKDTLIDAITTDSFSIFEMSNAFINSLQKLKEIDNISERAFTLKYPYKKALAINANTINDSLKNLADNDIFKSGGFIKDYQAQSRVLVGGKVFFINYNYENLKEDLTRKETKTFISRLGFAAIKKRDGNANDTETVELESLTLQEARDIFDSVSKTNEALENYFNSEIPNYLKNRKTISNLVTFASGLTGGNAAFLSIKKFFENDDNLKAFNLVAPLPVAKLLATFLGVSTFAAFSGIVATASAAYLLDYLRKYIIANLFSMMDLQYKITDILEKFDHDYVDALIEVHNQGYRICKKLASTRSWEK